MGAPETYFSAGVEFHPVPSAQVSANDVSAPPEKPKPASKNARPNSLRDQPSPTQQLASHLQRVFPNSYLRVGVNKDLGEIVVQIVDKKSDLVLREIPPKELQSIAESVAKSIGQFVDQRG